MRILLGILAGGAVLLSQPPQVSIQAPYVTTPYEVVHRMLALADVKKTDVLYDLGCGDGRIVIAAARRFGARGVGIDLSPERIREARETARLAGVSRRVEFRQGDLFDADLAQATVVTLYLLPSVNLELRPKLLKELRPGARVVSYSFDMGDWKPDRVLTARGARIYFWVVKSVKRAG